MIPITAPVPPQLEEAIGWTGGECRWLAIGWSPCGDCPWLDDGRSATTGNGWGFLAWRRHRVVEPLLRDASLGDSDRDGTERVLLDRETRRVYLASATEAQEVVRGQWPEEPPVELTADEWKAVVEQVRHAMLNRPLPTMSELMRQLQEHSHLVGDMVRWLDASVGDRRE